MMRITLLLLSLLLAPVLSAHDRPKAPEPMELGPLLEAFGWDLAGAKISSQTVTDDLHVLFGLGGNIAVSSGGDGVLIVDDQFPELVPQIRAAIGGIAGRDTVDFAINTHWHFDHAAGNQVLGPQGTWLVAQENSRQMMQGDHVINLVLAAHEQKAYPPKALPVITFDQSMQFHLNGQRIELLHFGPAHTTGDAAVLFHGSRAVHMGDVFNNAGYPFIDADNGGGIDGVISFCQQVLAQIDPSWTVIPGHGPLSDYQGLKTYIDMLVTVRARIQALLAEDATLEQVLAANVTAEFNAGKGDNRMFVDRAYVSLAFAKH